MTGEMRELRIAIRLFAAATVALFLVCAALATFGYIANSHRINDIQRVTEENTKARYALCAIRHDRQAEVDATQAFLKSHPDGFAGVSAAILRARLNEQLETVRALEKLRCP